MMPSIGYNVMKNIYFRLQLLSGVSCKPQCESNIVNWIKFNQIVPDKQIGHIFLMGLS